ncbi:MAG: KOW motif-containing protein [Labilithrix sp.]|nr:KOW motif-containing protein [Labilithrix sp.]
MKAAAPEGALRLSSADFDAFLDSGATARPSRRHPSNEGRPVEAPPAAQRRALRERIHAWARGVVPRLEQLGIAVEVVVPDEVEQHLSSRAPRAIAQRVIFVRDDFGRSGVPRTVPDVDPLRAHAYLALTIDSVHVEVSLELCPEAEADVKNLRARLGDPTGLLELTTLFETLPQEFAIGVIGVPSFPRAELAAADDVRALLDDSERNRRPLWLGWSVKREIALHHSSELDEQLADALVVLAHAYKLIAWAPDNDLIAAGRRGAWRAGRARAEERRERGREERRKRRSVRKGPVRIEGTRREREDARRLLSLAEREGPSRRGAAEPPVSRGGAREEAPEGFGERGREGGRPVPARRPILQTTLRARGARPALAGEVDPTIPIEKGTRVRVLAGPFANKVGVVQELDHKGRARVRLGLLAATLDLKDIVASADGSRPMLASSHRRPRNARSR